MRIDKFLADCGVGSRSEIKKILKQGRITLSGVLCTDPAQAVDETDAVTLDGNPVPYRKFVYLMMNKPQGVVSATDDNLHRTVLDLVPPEYAHFDLFPCGRLDIDTEGFLLLTNDGQTAHRLLSPKWKQPKTYFVRVDGRLTDEDVRKMEEGIAIEDYVTRPAQLTILQSGEASEAELTIYEGKFHQVKKMFAACGKPVTYLKRISFAGISLDPALPLGQVRELFPEEIALFFK